MSITQSEPTTIDSNEAKWQNEQRKYHSSILRNVRVYANENKRNEDWHKVCKSLINFGFKFIYDVDRRENCYFYAGELAVDILLQIFTSNNLSIVDKRRLVKVPRNTLYFTAEYNSDLHQTLASNCLCTQNQTCTACYTLPHVVE